MTELRAALQRACDLCPSCDGLGHVVLPLADVRCARCAKWRDLLLATRPWWVTLGIGLVPPVDRSRRRR